MRMTKRRRAAEAAAASSAMADAPDTRGVRARRAALESTIASIERNLTQDPGDPANPLSSAAAKLRMLSDYRERLAGLS